MGNLDGSLDGEPEESPEVIAKAWDEEIARRVANMEAGRTHWTPADKVMTRLRAIIGAARPGGKLAPTRASRR